MKGAGLDLSKASISCGTFAILHESKGTKMLLSAQVIHLLVTRPSKASSVAACPPASEWNLMPKNADRWSRAGRDVLWFLMAHSATCVSAIASGKCVLSSNWRRASQPPGPVPPCTAKTSSMPCPARPRGDAAMASNGAKNMESSFIVMIDKKRTLDCNVE